MIGTSLPVQGESVSPRATLRSRGGQTPWRGMRRFRDLAITLTAPPPEAREGSLPVADGGRLWTQCRTDREGVER